MKTLFTFLTISCFITLSFAQTTFSEKSQEVGINTEYLNLLDFGGGAAFFDYDMDGWEDVWVVRGLQGDKLYKNNGDGTFTDMSEGIAEFSSMNTMGVSTADLNNDGFRDVLLNTFIDLPDVLLKNNGDGTFTDITEESGLLAYDSWSISAAFGDVNNDGLLDIYVSNYIWNPVAITDDQGNVVGFAHECSPNWLFINDGIDSDNNPHFSLSSETDDVASIGCSLSAVLTDFDSDKDADIIVANDFGEWVVPNHLFENNNSDGVFSDIGTSSNMGIPMNGMGIAIGDYDQDNDLDYYITNIGENKLLANQADKSFINTSIETESADINADDQYTVGWGTFFFDADNDTDLDIFIANGYTPTADFIASNPDNPNRLLLNQLADNNLLTFQDYSTEAGVGSVMKGRGAAFADYDKDGDLDYIVVNVNAGSGDIEPVLFYENELANDNNWLQVKLVGTMTNRDAFGTNMKIVVGDKSWMYEIDGGSTHASQNSSIAHFGLGDATVVDTLVIYWPNSETQVITNLYSNQLVQIVEGETLSTNVNSLSTESFLMTAMPNPFKNSTTISYELPEASSISMNFYTATGKLVDTYRFEKPSGLHNFEWNMESLPQGLYLLKLDTGNKVRSIKLFKR